ncbi:MAG: sugar phosphate isomerase/epimerase, partial [Spirochaetales bacterium]|nr:sugar phosphate isomerase/epimerase [Spirochaetales bacterium]
MLKGINFWAFPPDGSGKPIKPEKALEMARSLGYDSFELTVEEKGVVSLEMSETDAERIKRRAESLGIKLITVASGLSWGCSPTDPSKEVREKAVSNGKKILKIAAWLGAETMLYVPGMVSAVFIPEFKPQIYDDVDKWAKDSLEKLIPTAEELKVKIGVENVWNRFLLSPAEMRAFIDYFNSPYVGSYFDVGNVMLYGHPEHWIKML